LLYARRGEPVKAETAYQAAIKLDPRFIPAYVNLADLYRATGRDGEGERTLRDAAGLAPNDASVRHALGLLLVREKRLAEANAELARAARLDHGNARYAYVYAIALDAAGRRAECLRILEDNRRRHPADRDTLMALLSFRHDAGESAAALVYARELRQLDPDEPAFERLIETLENAR
jgi:Flp pilus assembly protein TadD